MWKIFASIIHNKKIRSDKIHKIIRQNKEITEDKCIANAYNEYFCTAGQNLAQTFRKLIGSFRNSQANYSNYLVPRSNESMFLHPVTEIKVLKAIDSFQTNKAISDFDIPIKLINICKLQLSP